jgi:hypothetical protein
MVRHKVDVIAAAGTLAPLSAKQASSTISIVMTSAGDPLGSGLFVLQILQEAANQSRHDWPSGGGKAREDFADHAAIALAHVSDDDGEEGWFTEHYREWQRAFELVADGGAVQVFCEAQV